MKTQKGKLSSDRRFLINSFIKLLLIQPVFLWIAVKAAAAGHGMYFSFAVFYNWLILPGLFFGVGDNISNVWSVYFLLIPVILFLLSLILLLSLWNKVLGKKSLLLIMAVYFFGVITSYRIIREQLEPHNISLNIKIFGILLPLIAIYFFWKIFFQVIDYKKF